MWITITTDDVKTRLAGAEYDAYTKLALSRGQADPLPDLVAQVAREVRGHVAGGGHTLGDGLTIPEELMAAAVDMVVFRLTTRIGVPVKEDRRTANAQAKTLLGQVGRGEFLIVPPETAATKQAVASGPAVAVREKQFQMEDQDGI